MRNQQAGRRRRSNRPNSGGMPQNQQRQRGNAHQLLEKYKNMARDASQSGERVQAEYYLQFADHYFRVVQDMQAKKEEQQNSKRRGRGGKSSDDDDDDDDDDESEESSRREKGGRQRRNRGRDSDDDDSDDDDDDESDDDDRSRDDRSGDDRSDDESGRGGRKGPPPKRRAPRGTGRKVQADGNEGSPRGAKGDDAPAGDERPKPRRRSRGAGPSGQQDSVDA